MSSKELGKNAAFASIKLYHRCRLLCSKNFEALTSPDGYEHYNNIESEKHAKSGCRLCNAVIQSWEREGDDEIVRYEHGKTDWLIPRQRLASSEMAKSGWNSDTGASF